MKELKDSDFDQEVASGLVLVDFFTPYCGPCRHQLPILENCQDVVSIVKVDASENPDLQSRFKVSAVPTLVLLKDGVEVARNVGLTSRPKIEEMVKNAG